MSLFWFCLQEATEASCVATMKTIRQVKTVFIIFIAFVCCWSPYIVVLLYDASDSLPLPIHLYASMLAHLHASLNFAIYTLMNPNLRTDFVTRLLARCHRVTSSNASSSAAAAAAPHVSCDAYQSPGPGYSRRLDVYRPFVTAEYQQFQETGATNTTPSSILLENLNIASQSLFACN